MNKDSILYGVIGILLGLIIGFMGANTLNQRGGTGGGGAMSANSNMPVGHPEVGGNGGPSMQQIQDVVNKAKQDPDDFNAQLDAAGVYAQIGRYPDAVNFLKRANELKPDDINTIVMLGNALFDSEKYTDAAPWYEKALGKQDDANIRTDLGLTFLLRDPPDFDKAISEFQKSLALEPGHLKTLQNLTAAYVKKKDSAKAKDALAQLEKVDPKNEALETLKAEIEKLGTN